MRHSGPEYHEQYLGWLTAEALRDEFRVGTEEKVVEVARLRKLAQFVVEGFIGRIWLESLFAELLFLTFLVRIWTHGGQARHRASRQVLQVFQAYIFSVSC
jgi:hypothetical protein